MNRSTVNNHQRQTAKRPATSVITTRSRLSVRQLACRTLMLALLAVLALAQPAAAQPAEADGDGFIRHWLVCGTWPVKESERDLLPDDQLPYNGLVTMGRLWVTAAAQQSGFVDLAGLGSGNNQATLAHSYLFSDRQQKVKLLIGADDRAHLSVNGTWLHRSKRSGAWSADQESVDVTLDEGWNQVMLRVENDFALYGFSVRVTLSDGRPLSLKSSAQVPRELMDHPSLRGPLSEDELTELLELMTRRTAAGVQRLDAALREWANEGRALDESYADARESAIQYVTALREVLITMPHSEAATEGELLDVLQPRPLARRQLMEAAIDGPGPLIEPSNRLLDHARAGARLWEMGPFAAGVPLEIGHYAAEVDRTLADAAALLAAIQRRHLRPFRLKQQTLQHRTAPLKVNVIDAEGLPLKGASYTLEQVRHEFLFGCSLSAFGAFGRQQDNERYLNRFEELFNHAVVPAYWSLIEPRQGLLHLDVDERGLPGPDAMVTWGLEKNMSVRISPLLSSGTLPAWLRQLPADHVRQPVQNHLRRLTGRYALDAACFDLEIDHWRHITLGNLQLDVSQALATAKQNAPAARFYLRSSNVNTLIRAAQVAVGQGVKLDGLSWTLDLSRTPLPMEELDMQLARLRTTGLPVQICQVMIDGSRRHELAQAQAAEALYRTAFANPAVEGISWWDLSDRYAARHRPVGLLDDDLKPKEAWHRLSGLIKEQWWTEISGRLGDDGIIGFRGFFGTYRLTVTVEDGGRTYKAGQLIRFGRDDPREAFVCITR